MIRGAAYSKNLSIFSGIRNRLLLVLAVLVFLGAGSLMAVPVARDGLIDLSQYDFSYGPARLDGQWKITPGHLLEPSRHGGVSGGDSEIVPGETASGQPGSQIPLPGNLVAAPLELISSPRQAPGGRRNND